MSCFHPIQMDVFENEFHERIYQVHSYDNIVPDRPGLKFLYKCDLPCGNCVGCRQDRAKEWADRLLLESLSHDHTYFLTVTYNNLRLPPSNHYCNPYTGEIEPQHGTLVKRDLQLFIKRLRRHFSNDRIMYYAVGEYGDQKERPHYHLIVFGLDSLDTKNLIYSGKNKKGNPVWRSPELEEIWALDSLGEELKSKHLPYERGRVTVEEGNYYTFRYVSSYVTAKIGKFSDDRWLERGLEPPFNLMSRNPAIGRKYAEEHPEKCSGETEIVVPTAAGEVSMRSPRYFKKAFRLVFPDEANRIADSHARFALDRKAALLKSSDKTYLEQLKDKETQFVKKRVLKTNF